MSEREDDNETTEMENLSSSMNTKDIKKKRKNKKKRRAGGPRQKVSSEDVDGDNDDEITRTVKLVDKMFGTSSSHIGLHLNEPEPIFVAPKTLLSVQHKNLNPQTELKRMFGKVVNQEQQKKRRGVGNFRSIKAGSSLMTNPKDSWPPVNRTGLYMNLLQSSDLSLNPGGAKVDKNLLYFSFEHCKFVESVKKNLT